MYKRILKLPSAYMVFSQLLSFINYKYIYIILMCRRYLLNFHFKTFKWNLHKINNKQLCRIFVNELKKKTLVEVSLWANLSAKPQQNSAQLTQ